MHMTCSFGESWDVQLGFGCRIHDGSIRVADHDRIGGCLLIVERQVDGEEMGGAAHVGDSHGCSKRVVGVYWVMWFRSS